MENKLHWTLDVAFSEDAFNVYPSPVKEGGMLNVILTLNEESVSYEAINNLDQSLSNSSINPEGVYYLVDTQITFFMQFDSFHKSDIFTMPIPMSESFTTISILESVSLFPVKNISL